MSVDVSPPETRPTEPATRGRVLLRSANVKILLGVLVVTVVGLALVYLFGGNEQSLVTQAVVTGLLLGGV
jgi:hypothetical protein